MSCMGIIWRKAVQITAHTASATQPEKREGGWTTSGMVNMEAHCEPKLLMGLIK